MDHDFFSNLNLKKESEYFFCPFSLNGCLDGGISKDWTT
jgi:hypothetical protein